MAGNSGEAKRQPKRPLHVDGKDFAEATTETARRRVDKKTVVDSRGEKEQRGKENCDGGAPTHCHATGSTEKMEESCTHGSDEKEEPCVFFDEDSNHIFPIDQFFGNLDLVQDCPRKTTKTASKTRREHRRLHYYAKEDFHKEDC